CEGCGVARHSEMGWWTMATREGWRAHAIDRSGPLLRYVALPGARVTFSVSERAVDLRTMVHRSRDGGLNWEHVVAPVVGPLFVPPAAGGGSPEGAVTHVAVAASDEVRWPIPRALGEPGAPPARVPVEGPARVARFFPSHARPGQMAVAFVGADGEARLLHT